MCCGSLARSVNLLAVEVFSVTKTIPLLALGIALATLGLAGCGSSSNTTPPQPAPSITSLSPVSGGVGTPVTIAGANFGVAQLSSTVTFNGMAATPTKWSAASIVVPVPAGATTGNVVVTVGGMASGGAAFTVLPTPTITSLSPPSSAVGAPVTLTGTNFGATQDTSTVTFNGTTATPASWSATSITVSVPVGSTTGDVVVTVSGVASSGTLFTVLPTPSITSLLPTSGAVGMPLTIIGTNFGANLNTSTVTFNGIAATPTSWSGSSIAVPVPAGATTGNVVVTVGGGASGGVSFTVVPVSVFPQLAAVVASTQTQQFTAFISSGTGLSWSVDGVAGGNPTVGTISAGGLYSPPSTAGTHTVTASVTTPTNSASANIAVTDLAGVFTYHNDLSRDGANTQEYGLTASTVTTSTFGKLFSCPVDGATYTQPLWVPALSIGGGIHNVIFVATQHDTIFAFDADATPCVQYWQGSGALGEVNLLDTLHGGTAGEVSVPCQPGVAPLDCQVGVGDGDIQPEIGVTGTPAIDPTNNTIYVVSKSENTTTSTFYQRLHALDLTTGNEKFSAPILIAASVTGIGDGSSSGMVAFNPQNENQRPGLALSGGVVYLSWAAHEDKSPYHGWVIGYSAADVQMQVSVFNTTPNGGLGGIWAGGGAPAVDSGGDVYVSTGNGVFDEGSGMPMASDYGDSILRLNPIAGNTANGENLQLAGWFTPYDELTLEDNDTDLGSGGVVLLPDQSAAPTHLLTEVGKEGVVYLIDRDNMGQFQATNNSQIVQSFNGPVSGVWGSPAFWQNGLYIGGQGDNLRLFTFDSSTGLFNTTVSSKSAHVFSFPGDSPSVSSQGASNGIIWALDTSQYGPPAQGPGPAVLHAYNAADLGTEYWNSSMAANNRDQAGGAVKFVPPTIANGKVYVSTRTEIDVYGLLP
jgi:hypothetical protein